MPQKRKKSKKNIVNITARKKRKISPAEKAKKEARRAARKAFIKRRQETPPSPAEAVIMEILTRKQIPFVREAVLENLINPKTRAPLFFDFYLYTRDAVIEYDGRHHFQKLYHEDLEAIQFRDTLKNKYCKRQRIPMLRLPYWTADLEGAITQFLEKIC